MTEPTATATFELPSETSSVRCIECANRVCETLQNQPGVSRVDCDANGAAVRVVFDPARVSEADIQAEMDRFGMELASTVRHAAWRVTGLD